MLEQERAVPPQDPRAPAVPPGRGHLRVVSLTCSNTEIVCELGCADVLVGVDDHSDFPVEVVGRLPRVGPDLGVDVDAVKRLEPDLVLASLTVPGHERVVDAIDRAGLRYVAPAPESLADVSRDLRDLAALLGVPERGDAAARAFEDALVQAPDTGRSVLVEWWPKPVIAAGRRSWIQQLVARAGGRNALADRDVASTPLTDAEVVALAPDHVVVSWCGVPFERYRLDVVRKRAAWATVPALVSDRVHAVPEAWLGRPGPRLVEGYRAIRELLALS